MHLAACKFKPMECECGEIITKHSEAEHDETCPFAWIPCPYYDFDSGVDIIDCCGLQDNDGLFRRKDLPNHLRDHGARHAELLAEALKKCVQKGPNTIESDDEVPLSGEDEQDEDDLDEDEDQDEYNSNEDEFQDEDDSEDSY